jgi:integrase
MASTPAQANGKKLPPGISRRADGKLLAQVRCPRTGKRIGKVFGAREIAAAKIWRRDTQTALHRREITVADNSARLRQVAPVFLQGMGEGTIRTRSRRPYKPATIARYRRALDQYLLPQIGNLQLDEVTTGTLERLVDRLQASGLAASSVRNTFMPLQALYRWAVRRELVRVNPTREVELPLDRARRDRLASREEIVRRLETLPVGDRALWATGFYAGLRYGEMMALRWADIDLDGLLIHVERSYDPQAKAFGAPKSHAGIRDVPIPQPLHRHLIEHYSRRDQRQPLAFSRHSLGGRCRGADGVFGASGLYQRAHRHWKVLGLAPMTLHDCRHTYASLMIAAGENAKALQTYLGHSSITTTYDRYGHLMPGAERESAERLSAYLGG